jgi:hypothetical protein
MVQLVSREVKTEDCLGGLLIKNNARANDRSVVYCQCFTSAFSASHLTKISSSFVLRDRRLHHHHGPFLESLPYYRFCRTAADRCVVL